MISNKTTPNKVRDKYPPLRYVETLEVSIHCLGREMSRHEFAHFLKQLRSLLGWTQQGMGTALSVSRQMIHRYELGLSAPGTEVLSKLQQALHRRQTNQCLHSNLDVLTPLQLSAA